eukprot:gene18588-25100_t
MRLCKFRSHPQQRMLYRSNSPTLQPRTSRRKRKAKVDEQSLTEDERERRRYQKELRELALKLKSSGEQYKPQKHKRKVFVDQGAGKAGWPKKKGERNKRGVVVMPIFWEERTEEKASIITAVDEVEAILTDMGVKFSRDDNNKYMPGERMKHWEEIGIPLRIEIGPKDAKTGSCVVARSGEPGTVAQKTTVKKAVTKYDAKKDAANPAAKAAPKTVTEHCSSAKDGGSGEDDASDDSEAGDAEDGTAAAAGTDAEASQKMSRRAAKELELKERAAKKEARDGKDSAETKAAKKKLAKAEYQAEKKRKAEAEAEAELELEDERPVAEDAGGGSGGGEPSGEPSSMVQGAAKKLAGGDEMDDFDIEVEPEEDVLTMDKKERLSLQKKRLKMQRKMAKKGENGTTDADIVPDWNFHSEAKPKAVKTVVF